jgi:hypothetical protein
MDSWLTDQVKELFFQPCLGASERLGLRMENRIRMGQDIDERALTEDFLDAFDTSSNSNAWGTTLKSLSEHQIYMSTRIQKSTREYKVGADIGIIVKRQFYGSQPSKGEYACLVQCKKVGKDGYVSDFFHQVRSSGKYQSSLMLDITPSSFYFIYTPSSFIQLDYAYEPIAFVRANRECSSPVWNMGCFEYNGGTVPYLSEKQKREVSSILVVPALAVDTQTDKDERVRFDEILPNCIPLWYWFGELLIPSFVGDRKSQVISVAQNRKGNIEDDVGEFGVNYTINLTMTNG